MLINFSCYSMRTMCFFVLHLFSGFQGLLIGWWVCKVLLNWVLGNDFDGININIRISVQKLLKMFFSLCTDAVLYMDHHQKTVCKDYLLAHIPGIKTGISRAISSLLEFELRLCNNSYLV